MSSKKVSLGSKSEDMYALMSDGELIAAFREGDSSSADYLMVKYKDLVKKKAGSMYILGADRDDLIQEGMIGLFKAIRDYEEDKQTEFSSFASVCISRQMYTAIEASRRKKHAPLNTYISIYGDEADDDTGLYREGSMETLGKVLSSISLQDPEEILIDRENVDRIWEIIDKSLSPLEKRVLDLLLTGMDYMQIAEVLGRDPKSADNAIQRIKGKLKKVSI